MQRLTRNILKVAAPAALILGLTTGAASATIFVPPPAASPANITIYPGENSAGASDALGVPNNSAPGFSSGSFQANGNAKSAVRISADALFGSDSSVTVGDLLALDYWTNQDVPASGTPVNWYIAMYTVADQINDDDWYGRRLNFEPYFSANRQEADNQWEQWSTDGVGSGNENKLRVFDANRGDSGPVFGTYTDPFLSDLTSGQINWSDYSNAYVDDIFDYSDEEIWFIDISTGSSWAAGFDGLVDGFSISWNDGSGNTLTSTVNLEARAVAVPAPPMLVLTLIAFGALGLLSLQRRRHV